MTTQQKHELIAHAYTTMQKGDDTIHILDTDKLDSGTQGALLNMQEALGVGFDQSYEIMSDACDIIADKTLDGTGRDSLTGDDLDFFADADSRANVYTAVQLSYLNSNNESDISDLMKDESFTSIAQACSVWRIQKVVEACEALKAYILN
jgi:hypothetical protein